MINYYELGHQDGVDGYIREGVERLSVDNADEYEQGFIDAENGIEDFDRCSNGCVCTDEEKIAAGLDTTD